jgi:hypothetical protein
LRVFQRVIQLADLISAQAGGLVGRKIVLRVIAFLGGFGEFVGKLVGTLGLREGVGNGFVTIGLGVGQILLGLLKIALGFDQHLVCLDKFGLRGVPAVSVGVPVGDKRVDLVLDENKVHNTHGERRDNGQNKTDANQHGGFNFQQTKPLAWPCQRRLHFSKTLFPPSWTREDSRPIRPVMKLNHGLHLAYCTNIHRGETWRETFNALKSNTLAVRERVCPRDPFAIGLRLSNQAAMKLSDPKAFLEFQRWLEQNSCYVFTINGFPYGQFHDTRVKEQVYAPDWTSQERLTYTNLLFDLLVKLLPAGIAGSVSTVPGSFKEFIQTDEQEKIIRKNLWRCVEHIARVAEKSNRELHLGLEPEPLGLLENSAETIRFFEQLRSEHPNDLRLDEHLGINYDTCHFAIEFEEPHNAIAALQNAGIKISKIHLSSALKTRATGEARSALKYFADDVYLHQVVARDENGKSRFYRDLPDALADNSQSIIRNPQLEEWRIHFHVPLHTPAAPPFENTNDHLLGVLDLLAKNPKFCSHLEMETYTWEVLPPELKTRSVVEQLAAEYGWTLARLAERGLANR